MSTSELSLQVMRPYLSIKNINIDTDTLPQITVITGINGVGKTHFLDGMVQGKIEATINNKKINQIVKYDSTTINTTKLTHSIQHPDTHQGENIITAFVSVRNELLKTINFFSQIEEKIINKDLDCFINDSTEHQNLVSLVIGNAGNIDEFTNVTIRTNNKISFLLDTLIKKINYQMNNLNIGSLIPPLQELSKTDPHLFWYGDKYQIYKSPLLDKAANTPFSDLMDYLFKRENERYHNYITDYQIAKQNNTALPKARTDYFWNKINQLFSNHHFDFEFKAEFPTDEGVLTYYNDIFKFSLNKQYSEQSAPKLPDIKNFGLFQKSTGIKIEENHLSSGEKIIFFLLKVIFNANNYTPSNNYPKLVLLDEIDAHLHPKNCQYAFNFIKTLATEYDIYFIITTHTASTVALFDDVNIYELAKPTNISDAHRLKKITKNEAVHNLTSGVPTLSFDISGNKYVFVESENDVCRYTHIYDALIDNKILPLFPKLLFINIGVNGENKNAVKSLVSKIENKSVCGLIDWDTQDLEVEYQNKRIFQLSRTKRYAIENLILDPVFVISALQEKKKLFCYNINNFPTSILDLKTVTQEQWQEATNILMQKLQFDMKDRIDIEYLNGFTIQIPEAYLFCCPHKDNNTEILLEDTYKEKMPVIFNTLIANPIQNNNTILKNVLSCVSHHTIRMIPQDLIDTFKQILNK